MSTVSGRLLSVVICDARGAPPTGGSGLFVSLPMPDDRDLTFSLNHIGDRRGILRPSTLGNRSGSGRTIGPSSHPALPESEYRHEALGRRLRLPGCRTRRIHG